MSKEKRRVPKLRFPGFTEDWEQRKLGDFTNQINTFVNPEDAKLPLWSLTAEAGLIEKSDRYERDFLVKKKDQYKRIETNTLVYNPMNITIGSIDIYTGLYPIAVSGYYVSIVYDKNIDTDFLKEVLLLPSSLKMYKNYATGSLIERQRVQYPTFSKLQLLLPNLDEQKAIGQIFKSLNLNITLHQRKLEHLNLKKKALLQKLFPKNGERYPELRFPGFTDAWEQRKLGDLMEVTSVKRIHQADWTDSGVRFFRARDIVSSMNNEEVDNPVFISEDKYEEYSRISGKVIEGDLLVTGVGTIGVPYLIKDSTPLYFKDGNIIWFKNNNILNGEYFYYCFQNNSIQSQIYSASGKGTVGTYTIENGKKTSISYPSLKEQVKIGKLLDTMAIMITLHQRKLEHLQLQKKSLLQQMFV